MIGKHCCSPQVAFFYFVVRLYSWLLLSNFVLKQTELVRKQFLWVKKQDASIYAM